MKIEDLNRPTKDMAKSLHHAGVNIKTLSSPVTTISEKLNELKKISNNGALLDKIFGAKQGEFAKGLLTHANGLQEIINKTKQKGVADEMAAEREKTLEKALLRLKAAWVNMLVGTDKAIGAVSIFMRVVDFLTQHLETIVTVGISVLGFFTLWKATLILAKVSLVAWNVALGIFNTLTGTSTVYMEAQTIAMTTQMVVTKGLVAAQWLLNAALTANPIGIIIVAFAAIVGAIYEAQKNFLGFKEFLYGFGSVVMQIFTGIGNIIAGALTLDVSKFAAGISQLSSISAAYHKGVEKADAAYAKDHPDEVVGGEKGIVDTRSAYHKAQIEKYEQTNNAKVHVMVEGKNGASAIASGSKGVNVQTTSTMPSGGGGSNW